MMFISPTTSSWIWNLKLNKIFFNVSLNFMAVCLWNLDHRQRPTSREANHAGICGRCDHELLCFVAGMTQPPGTLPIFTVYNQSALTLPQRLHPPTPPWSIYPASMATTTYSLELGLESAWKRADYRGFPKPWNRVHMQSWHFSTDENSLT